MQVNSSLWLNFHFCHIQIKVTKCWIQSKVLCKLYPPVSTTITLSFLCDNIRPKGLFTALVTYPVCSLLLNRILYLGTFPMSTGTKYCHWLCVHILVKLFKRSKLWTNTKSLQLGLHCWVRLKPVHVLVKWLWWFESVHVKVYIEAIVFVMRFFQCQCRQHESIFHNCIFDYVIATWAVLMRAGK